MPSQPTLYSPVPARSWSGFSIGIVGAAGFGRSAQSYTDQSFSTDDYKLRGGLVGAHSSIDVQNGNWVWGLGSDLQWALEKGSVVAALPAGGTAPFTTRLEWLSTIYVKVGYSFERFMPYVVAGPAFGGVRVSGTIPVRGAVSNSETWLGWGLGAGLAYAITPNLIARAEYIYVCLGESVQFSVDNAEFMTHLARFGLDYKFSVAALENDTNQAQVAAANTALFNWTGFYVGFNMGGLTGQVGTIYTVGGISPFVGLRPMGGLQAGYNMQIGHFVVGAESDFQLTGQESFWRFSPTAGGVTASITTAQKVPVLFTARARAGDG